MTPETAIKLAAESCECDDITDCLPCMLAEVINKLRESNKQLPIMRAAVKEAQDKHNIHIEALKHYYHTSHKDCPCLLDTGKCNSPWETIMAPEEKLLSRDDELKAIAIFMERKNANRNN